MTLHFQARADRPAMPRLGEPAAVRPRSAAACDDPPRPLRGTVRRRLLPRHPAGGAWVCDHGVCRCTAAARMPGLPTPGPSLGAVGAVRCMEACLHRPRRGVHHADGRGGGGGGGRGAGRHVRGRAAGPRAASTTAATSPSTSHPAQSLRVRAGHRPWRRPALDGRSCSLEAGQPSRGVATSGRACIGGGAAGRSPSASPTASRSWPAPRPRRTPLPPWWPTPSTCRAIQGRPPVRGGPGSTRTATWGPASSPWDVGLLALDESTGRSMRQASWTTGPGCAKL